MVTTYFTLELYIVSRCRAAFCQRQFDGSRALQGVRSQARFGKSKPSNPSSSSLYPSEIERQRWLTQSSGRRWSGLEKIIF